MVEVPASALVGHLVGDYLLQNDYLAKHKKTNSLVCFIHCLIWSVCVTLFAVWPWWTILPLLLSHFVQDRTNLVAGYMDMIGQHDFRVGPCAPWSAIVVDNTLHLLAIWTITLFV